MIILNKISFTIILVFMNNHCIVHWMASNKALNNFRELRLADNLICHWSDKRNEEYENCIWKYIYLPSTIIL